MNVLFFAYLHGFGGAEKQIVMLANAMVKRGHDVTLLSVSANNQCYQLEDKVTYRFLPDNRDGLLRIADRYKGIKQVLEDIRPDITVSFWYQTVYLTAMIRKKITGKILFSERGDPGDKEYGGLLGILRALTIPKVDGFVFQSRAAQSFFNKKVRDRSVIIPNPIILNEASSIAEDRKIKRIINVGRLHPQKNQRILIEAFARVFEQITDYTLEIYGDGPLKNELEEYIGVLGLRKKVHIHEPTKDIQSIIKESSLFVLCSDYEGMPNVLIEAMALGVPCISTDYRPGSVKEIIDNRVNGIIVPPNDLDNLSNAMIEVIKNESLANYLSKNGMKSRDRFASESIYDKWETFLESMCYKVGQRGSDEVRYSK